MSLAPPLRRSPPRRQPVEARTLPASSATSHAPVGQRPSPRRNLQASIGDAAGYSVMVGIGETYFAAFALALGTGETFAGLIATLPMLCGATLQLLTPYAVARTGSYRRWVVGCVCLQAASLLLMPLAAWFIGSAAGWWVFAAAVFYWASGLSTAPAWNTWIEEIIPRPVRARYFARRARISQICTLLGFAAGGLALHVGKSSGGVLPVFCTILLIAAACRFASAAFLNRQSDASNATLREKHQSLRALVTSSSFFKATSPTSRVGNDRSSQRGEGGRLICYLLAVQTAVQISGPYFTPYLLSEEGVSYLSYMVLIGIGFLGKALALPLWGRVAHAGGAQRLLWIGGGAIVPIAGLWIFSDLFDDWQLAIPAVLAGGHAGYAINGEFIFLGCVQMLSGIAWAAYELAMMLMFFEAIPRSHRTSMLTLYNFGNAAATVVGGLIGATILQLLQETHNAYLALFGISSVVRVFTLLPLLRTGANNPRIVAIDLPAESSIEARIPVGPATLRIDPAAAKPLPDDGRSAAA